MIRIAFVAIVAVVAALSAPWGLRWIYGLRKLAILEPKELRGSIVWAGRTTARCRLVIVGDSRVARWPLRPPVDWRVGKVGFPGQSATNIGAAVPGALAGADADIVVIAAGINDVIAAALLAKSNGEAAVARAGAAIISAAEAARVGGSEPIVLTVPPLIALPLWKRLIVGDGPVTLVARLNMQLAAQARARNIELLDADAIFHDAEGRLLEAFHRDDLHWSTAGYQALEARLWARTGRCAE